MFLKSLPPAALLMLFAVNSAWAQVNPSNPCDKGAGNPCNPCAAKEVVAFKPPVD